MRKIIKGCRECDRYTQALENYLSLRGCSRCVLAIRKRLFCTLPERFLFAFTARDVLKPFKFRVESVAIVPTRKIRKSRPDNLSTKRGVQNALFCSKTNNAKSYCVIGPGIWKSTSPVVSKLALERRGCSFLALVRKDSDYEI